MSLQFKLNVTARAQTGRSASRRLRKINRVPAILYGKHTSPESLSVEGPEFIRLLKSVAGRAVLIELARAVYVTNDQRAAAKKRINLALGSRIVEEKSYKPY